MTENIFTEEQYKAITDCFDKLRIDYNYGLLNSFLVDKLQQELNGTVNINIYWPKIVAIANPETREEAKEKYVEKEKKYYWVSNKFDNEGNFPALYKNELGIVIFEVREVGVISRLTISEIEEWGYNPDMFDKEEV